MAETVIGSTIAGTIAKATGRGHQGHLQWAVNDSAWWLFYLSSADTTHLLTYRSPDGATWTAKSSLLFENSGVHNNNSQDFGIAYANISSTDVFHNNFFHETSTRMDHARGTAASGAMTWGTDTFEQTGAGIAGSYATAIADNNFVFDGYSDGNIESWKSTNADTGSSWTTGFGTRTALSTSSAVQFNVVAARATSTNRILYVYDKGSSSSNWTGLNSITWDGTTLGSEIAIVTGVTAQDFNDWGLCKVSDTDIHLVYRTSATAYTHKRWNGTNWTSVSGATIPSQGSTAGAGIALVSNGTDVWLGVIGSDANTSVVYIRWTASTNTWDGAWTTLESSAKVRKYITAAIKPPAAWQVQPGYADILFAWTETNGSNFDIAVELLQARPLWYLVQAPNTGTSSATWGSTTTGGSELIAVAACNYTSTGTISLTGWSAIGSTLTNTNVALQVFNLANSSSRSGTESPSFSGAGFTLEVILMEWVYSGGGSGPVDVTVTNTGSSAAPTTASSGTLGAANELVIAAYAEAATQSTAIAFSAPTNGFALAAAQGYVGGLNILRAETAAYYFLASATTALSSAVTSNTNSTWVSEIISFKNAGSPVVDYLGWLPRGTQYEEVFEPSLYPEEQLVLL